MIAMTSILENYMLTVNLLVKQSWPCHQMYLKMVQNNEPGLPSYITSTRLLGIPPTATLCTYFEMLGYPNGRFKWPATSSVLRVMLYDLADLPPAVYHRSPVSRLASHWRRCDRVGDTKAQIHADHGPGHTSPSGTCHKVL